MAIICLMTAPVVSAKFEKGSEDKKDRYSIQFKNSFSKRKGACYEWLNFYGAKAREYNDAQKVLPGDVVTASFELISKQSIDPKTGTPGEWKKDYWGAEIIDVIRGTAPVAESGLNNDTW